MCICAGIFLVAFAACAHQLLLLSTVICSVSPTVGLPSVACRSLSWPESSTGQLRALLCTGDLLAFLPVSAALSGLG